MSMYLFDQHPIIATREIAEAIGLTEAIVLQQIHYWVEVNKKSGKNYHEGRYWTYNSIKSWQEKDFTYLSVDTVKRTFAKLERAGYLLSGNYNKDSRDKTKWYSICEERLLELYQEKQKEKLEKQAKALEIQVPNALGQNAPMEKCNLPQSSSAKSTYAQEQLAPMQDGDLPQALPEISTENYSKTYNSDLLPSPSPSHVAKAEVEIKNKTYELAFEELKTQVGYIEFVSTRKEAEFEKVEEILRILAELMTQNTGDVWINQHKIPIEEVKSRFKELTYSHMEYMLDVMRQNTNLITNIRAYIITVAYNAPTSMDAYYSALVNHHMKGGAHD